MANTYKTLGQQKPSAATSTTLYTCPSVTATIASVVTVCNQSATPTTFRLGIDVGGGGDATTDYHYYDCPIAGNQTIELMRGVCLAASDLLRCYNTLATLSFNVSGVEIT